MRNLRNLKHNAIEFGEDFAPLSATAWDGTGLLVAFGPTEDNATITLKRLQNDSWNPDQAVAVASWDAPSPNPDLPCDRILSLHCLPDTGSICLILEGGDIVVVREDPQPGEDLIEIVGSVDAGISAAAWSPDEELLMIATKADTLLFMTREFEGTATISLTPEDLQISNHVSVGWGKKETQFQGRGAKALRDPTVPEHVDEGKLSSLDDSSTTISWRGDGQFVAINSLLNVEPKRRVIRVYSREGVLDSVSEPVDGLEAALSWKPSGQIIAGVQRREDSVDIVFFERNGLRHGEFDLRLDKEQMKAFGSRIDLAWNNDSSVLAVSMKDRVQLWTMGNYHYYLKQEIIFWHTTGNIVSIDWHSEKALQLVCSSGSQLRLLDYTFEVARGSVAPPHDYGAVAVIDGKMLKITPLRTANIPPPMAFDEVELKANAVDVAFNDAGDKFAVLHDNSVSLWTCEYGSKPARRGKLEAEFSLHQAGTAAHLIARHLTFDESRGVTIISTSQVNEADTQFHEPSEGSLSWVRKDKTISRFFAGTNSKKVLGQGSKGEVMHLSSPEPEASLGKFPTSCVAVEVWQDESASHIFFGLTAGGTLYVQSEIQDLKIPGCTSFIVTATHLIFTTSSHLLKFVHLRGGELEIPPDEPEKDERCRNIERGAKLVTVMPSAYSLVLQMPRGNLETIYPRALVLAGIRSAIGERNYKKAFSICRTQRVDMNILHDYAPEQFMGDVEMFVKQLKKAEYIDLVLSSLSEEDVSQTIYKDTIKITAEETGANGNAAAHLPSSLASSSKVNRICDAFLKVLTGQESSHLQSIVTSHVCKNPPDLAAGLSLISDLRKKDDETQLEQAIEHICFLADVNQLYDTALGLYDLDVALLVAQQSQKDPREYLPYLQKLQDMEALRQRFSIDDDLKRYPKALTHLHAMNEFEELKTYVIKHDLYNAAIDLYRYENARLIELMRLHADYLSSRNRYEDAGKNYEYIDDHAAAYEAYRAAGVWQECLACALRMKMSSEKIQGLATELADSLIEAKDYTSAAEIHLEHLGDVETTAKLLCRAYKFAYAIRLVENRGRSELLHDLVDSGLIDASATMTEMLAEMKTQLQAQIPRLRDLRVKKAEDPMAFLDGGVDGGDVDIPDNISLAATDATTSAGTLMTRYTNRSMGTVGTNATRKTSKNRRREERKRARGKKGTVYEEEYLVNSITRLIERLNDVAEDVERLLNGLYRRKMRERAIAVHSVFHDVRRACEECMQEVYGAENGVGVGQAVGVNPSQRVAGGEGVMIEAIEASQQRKQAPVLKAFKKFALLDS